MGEATGQDIPEVSAEALDQLIGGGAVHVIDVRLPFDYFGGRVPGALNMPGESIIQNADRLPGDARLVMVCDDGRASRKAALAALQAGFKEVSILAGGFDAWCEADLPTETISEGMLTPQSQAPKPKS